MWASVSSFLVLLCQLGVTKETGLGELRQLPQNNLKITGRWGCLAYSPTWNTASWVWQMPKLGAATGLQVFLSRDTWFGSEPSLAGRSWIQ
jgi:hypothetical protein